MSYSFNIIIKKETFARSDKMTSILQRLKRGREPTIPGDEIAFGAVENGGKFLTFCEEKIAERT